MIRQNDFRPNFFVIYLKEKIQIFISLNLNNP